MAIKFGISRWSLVVSFSLLLYFFTLPHILEDFATGEPIAAGVPPALLGLVISLIFSLQALGLYWLGQKRRWGLFVHAGIGLFWPIASGAAQLPTILREAASYRSGMISIVYVGGIFVVGILLCIASIISLVVDARAG